MSTNDSNRETEITAGLHESRGNTGSQVMDSWALCARWP